MTVFHSHPLLEKIVFIVEDVTEIEKLEADIQNQRNQNALKIEKLQAIVANSKESIRLTNSSKATRSSSLAKLAPKQ